MVLRGRAPALSCTNPAAEGRHDVGEGRHVDAVGWEARGHDDHLRATRRARCRARGHTCRPLVGGNLGRMRLYEVPGGARLGGWQVPNVNRDVHEPQSELRCLCFCYI